MPEPVVAVTGASGRAGGRVAQRLTAAGVRQRLVVRDPSRAPELPGAEVGPPAEYRDGEAMRRALDGTTTLFLVSGRESADRVAEHVTAVDAAVAAGVERIVYLSFSGAAADATFTFARDHWHTEQHIRGTGLRFTFLRDNLYQAEFAVFAGPNGVIRGPAEDGRAAAVAHDDVADVAAVVLLDEAAGPGGHDGATYDITGPAALSLQDAAAELSRVSGRTIRYLPETEEEAYESRSVYGAPEFEVAGWVTTYLAIATGELSTVSDTVERLTGHPPQQFAEFLRANPWSYQRLIA